VWSYSWCILHELPSSFLPLQNYFLLIFQRKPVFCEPTSFLFTNGDWKQNAFQLKLAIMTFFLNQRACPRCPGGKASSEPFKCDWSTRTISHNGRPKESSFVLHHCPSLFKHFYPGFQIQSSQDPCILFCEI